MVTTAMWRCAKLLFLSVLSFLFITSIVIPASAANGTVNYFSNTASEFSGQALAYKDSPDAKSVAASFLPALDCSFSATTEYDGSMKIAITLNAAKKVFTAEVDGDGDIMKMRSQTLDGKPAVFEEADREQLQLLARTLNPSFDDFTLVRERFAAFANYMIGRFPAGLVLDISFLKTATKPSQMCWQFGTFSNVTLLGTDFVDKVRNHQLDPWLKARKMVYDAANDAICGLKYTSICKNIGSVYTGKPGFVTTLPLDDPGNPKEKPHMTTYHGNHSPIGVLVKYDNEVNNDFCLGRCGPGCYGQLVDTFNASYYTVSAECFAHDVCIGEVGFDTVIPIGGIGDACMDELLNATWGYVNGQPCNIVHKKDLLGWWVIASEYLLLSKVSTSNGYALQQVQDGTRNNLLSVGTYYMNDSLAKKRVLTAIKFKNPDSSLVNWFYTGLFDTPATINDGLWTNDNKSIISLKGHKSSINGTISDSQTNKLLPGVTIQITGDNLDVNPHTAITDAKGKFLFLDVSPYDTYTVTLSKATYKNRTATTQVAMDNTPLSYSLDPASMVARPENIRLGLFTSGTQTTWTFTQYGSTNPLNRTAFTAFYSSVDDYASRPPYGKVVWSGNNFSYTFVGNSPNDDDMPILSSNIYDSSKWSSYNISITGKVDASNNLLSASININTERIYPSVYNQPPTSWASQGNSCHLEYQIGGGTVMTPGTYTWSIYKGNAASVVSGLKATYAEIFPYDNGKGILTGVDWSKASSEIVGWLRLW